MDESSTFEVKAQAGRKGAWKVTLDAEALTLEAVDGDETFQILHSDAEEELELRELGLLGTVLILNFLKKKVVFKIEKGQIASLREWFGPPTIRGLKIALKRRLRWCLPLGVIIVLTSLPLEADPAIGMQAVPFDAVAAFLGSSLVALSLLARVWPQRLFILLDCIWLSLLAIKIAIDIYRGDSLWWFILVVLLISGAKGSFLEFQRFAGYDTSIPPADEQDELF